MNKRACITIIVMLLVCSFGAYAANLSVENFSALPDVKNMRLSRDGNMILYLSRLETKDAKGYVVNVLDITSNKKESVLFAPDSSFRLKWVKWANDSKLLVSAIFPDSRFGVKTTETRLYILDIKTKKYRDAVPRRKVEEFAYYPQFQDQVLDILPDNSDHFLLELDGHSPNWPDVYRVSLKKRSFKLVQSSQHNVRSWWTDSQGNVRLGLRFNGNTEYKIVHKKLGGSQFKVLWGFEQFSKDEVWPIGFAKDPNVLYVSALHHGKDAIFKVDLNDPSLEKVLVYANKNYDVYGDLVYSGKTKEPVGLELSDDGGFIFWNEAYKALANGINKGLPGRSNSLISFSDDENRYIVYSSNDTDSGTYYLGDRKKRSLVPIGYRYKSLLPELMSPKKKVSYKARDGLDIEAYLTLPKSAEEKRRLPSIIFPHGGPIGNDGDGFDYWTQYFANEGYAVLQMNVRGSSGYGHDFMAAGLQKWGLAMQDDVADGARWMIEEGYADPDQMCIVGASYGGYAALMGAVKTPDLYKCVVSFAGVTDLKYLVSSHFRFTNYDIVKSQIGSNSKSLSERSPTSHAGKVRVPVLLIHGTEDRAVRYEHSKRMNSALKKSGADVEFVTLDEGDHYLSKGDHRLEAFKAMDRFLKKYLKR